MIDWISTNVRMPTERGKHLLYSEKHDQVIGPFPWMPNDDGREGMWCDLFATPEAGQAYGPPLITHWAEWNSPSAEKSSG